MFQIFPLKACFVGMILCSKVPTDELVSSRAQPRGGKCRWAKFSAVLGRRFLLHLGSRPFYWWVFQTWKLGTLCVFVPIISPHKPHICWAIQIKHLRYPWTSGSTILAICSNPKWSTGPCATSPYWNWVVTSSIWWQNSWGRVWWVTSSLGGAAMAAAQVMWSWRIAGDCCGITSWNKCWNCHPEVLESKMYKNHGHSFLALGIWILLIYTLTGVMRFPEKSSIPGRHN